MTDPINTRSTLPTAEEADGHEAHRIIGDLVGHAHFVATNFDVHYAHLHEAENFLSAALAHPGQVREIAIKPTPEMVEAAHKILNESWWFSHWGDDVPRDAIYHALSSALALPLPVQEPSRPSRPTYKQIIELVQNCVRRMHEAGESWRMMSRWISEDIDDLLPEADCDGRCPRPYNDRPSDFSMRDCIEAGECGCVAFPVPVQEPVCCGKPVHEGSPEAYTLECCGKFLNPETASVREGWSRSINYGPEGEENWANLITPEGDHVANIRTYHADRIVREINRPQTCALSPFPSIPEEKGTAESVLCPCTTFEQDEDCPVGYPSMLCSACAGTGNAPLDKVVALAAEMMKVAEQVGELEDPFAAWESIELIKSQRDQLRKAMADMVPPKLTWKERDADGFLVHHQVAAINAARAALAASVASPTEGQTVKEGSTDE